MIYLASPYSHPDAAVRKQRFDQACLAAAVIMSEGHVVFSPIAHSHPVARYLPPDKLMSWDFWKGQDFPILARCDEVWVLKLPGWDKSTGVQAEITYAEELGIPVRYFELQPGGADCHA